MSAGAKASQTILLADDSSTIQRLVTQTFAESPYDVVCVNNGDAAIRRYDEIRPDVVLADIYMPGKDGFQVSAYIQAHPHRPAAPVILLVGAFDAFDGVAARDAGAASYITKPFEPQALIEMVKSVIENALQAAAQAEKALEASANDAAPVTASRPETGDLLGLETLFQPAVVTVPADLSSVLSSAQIDVIADRVIQRLSAQVVENIAWDVVPDIATRVLREELKRTPHEG